MKHFNEYQIWGFQGIENLDFVLMFYDNLYTCDYQFFVGICYCPLQDWIQYLLQYYAVN